MWTEVEMESAPPEEEEEEDKKEGEGGREERCVICAALHPISRLDALQNQGFTRVGGSRHAAPPQQLALTLQSCTPSLSPSTNETAPSPRPHISRTNRKSFTLSIFRWRRSRLVQPSRPAGGSGPEGRQIVWKQSLFLKLCLTEYNFIVLYKSKQEACLFALSKQDLTCFYSLRFGDAAWQVYGLTEWK